MNNSALTHLNLNEPLDLNEKLEEIRNYLLKPGKFKDRKKEIISVSRDEESVELTLGQFFISVYFLRIIKELENDLRPMHFFKGSDASEINGYINTLSDIYKSHSLPLGSNELKHRIAKNLVEFSDDMARIVAIHGSTLNLYSLGELAKKDSSFKELLNFVIPDGLELFDIEKLVDEKVAEMINFLTSNESCYQELIKGKAVNPRQIGQAFLSIGLKPDTDGSIIPDPINTSFIRGLKNREDYYASAIGARKALIINFTQVKNSGYLANQLSKLCANVSLSDEECCDTKFAMPVDITNAETLRRVVGRYTSENYVIKESDTHLIGTSVDIYSPITCAAKNGTVCKRCYGELHKSNYDYNVGMIAVVLLTFPLTQMLLSSKHLLMAKTEKVKWSDDFNAIFSVDRDSIFPSLETSRISFESSDVNEDDDGDLYVNKVIARFRGKNVAVVSPKKLFLMESESKRFSHDSSKTIKFDVDPTFPAFKIKTKNVELSAALNSLIDLLNKNDHGGLNNDICEIFNSMLNRLNESKIDIMSVHIEIILSQLIFEGTSMERPDFSSEKEHDIVVKRVGDAIINSPILSASLAFEQIKKQLNNPQTYEKTKTGVLDRLFV